MKEIDDEVLISSDCNEQDTQFIINQINQFNLITSPTKQDPPSEAFNLLIRDSKGHILGGLLGIYYRFALYVNVLWICDELRGKGYGSALLQKAEKILIEKGCKLIHLDTWDFQAPDFYRKQGFEIFGILDGFPEGTKRYFLKKEL